MACYFCPIGNHFKREIKIGKNAGTHTATLARKVQVESAEQEEY